MKNFFSLSILLIIMAVPSFSSCNQEEKGGTPVLNMHTRFMREEVAEVKVSGVGNMVMTVDFGDGTILEGTASKGVTHRYEAISPEGNGYIDYDVKVSLSGTELSKTVRVYDLLCITSLMKQITAPECSTVLNMTHRANTTNLSIPENSISALKACIAQGVDAVETDTHVTSDGVIVISHDPTINRCTNGVGTIAEMTYADIQKYYLLDRRGNVTTEKIPTLEEFLKAGRGKIYYDLDYSPRTASTEQVMSVVKKLDMMEQVWFYCNSTQKMEECFNLDQAAQVYFWVTNYSAADSFPGIYFTQSSYNPDGTHTSTASVGAAEAHGYITSVIALDNAPETYVEEKDLTDLLNLYPNCRMIMNNVGDAMLASLQKRGLHD